MHAALLRMQLRTMNVRVMRALRMSPGGIAGFDEQNVISVLRAQATLHYMFQLHASVKTETQLRELQPDCMDKSLATSNGRSNDMDSMWTTMQAVLDTESMLDVSATCHWSDCCGHVLRQTECSYKVHQPTLRH